MSENMKNSIERKLNVLLGQPFINMGRASNLLWLNFGDEVVTTDIKGNENLRNKYALNIQCPWRLLKEGKSIIELNDIYTPRNGRTIDSFNWEEYGDNMFDEKLNIYKSNLHMILVSKLSAEDDGSLKIEFNNSVKLEILPDSKLKHEFWRFIIFGDISDHFVVFDN